MFKLVILKECDHFTDWVHYFQVYNALYKLLYKAIFQYRSMLFNLNSNWFLIQVAALIWHDTNLVKCKILKALFTIAEI